MAIWVRILPFSAIKVLLLHFDGEFCSWNLGICERQAETESCSTRSTCAADGKRWDGCRWPTLLACALCAAAVLGDPAERRFHWSHFCQTRQAATRPGIQGVPADESPTCMPDYPDQVPGSSALARIKGAMKGFRAEYLHTFALLHIRERPCWQFATVALSLEAGFFYSPSWRAASHQQLTQLFFSPDVPRSSHPAFFLLTP